jgi:DMATS type aromatic prenyltransferase
MTRSLFTHGAKQLLRLCTALGLDDRGAVLRTYEDLSLTWGKRPLDQRPRWSGATDDCSPLEFSVLFGAPRPELRLLVEAQADPASASSYWSAGLQLNDRLRARYGAALAVFERIADLYSPADHQVFFSTFHGAVFRSGGPPAFKIYLNPAARGQANTTSICALTFSRLGFSPAWTRAQERLRPGDRIVLISVDLLPASPRLKLYVRPADSSVEDLERLGGLARGFRVGDAQLLCRHIAQVERGALGRAPFSTYYYVNPANDLPERVTTHMPAVPFCQTDDQAIQRTLALFETHGLPSGSYERCARALVADRAETSPPLHSWVSFQREGDAPRITVYWGATMFAERFGAVAVDQRTSPWPA